MKAVVEVGRQTKPATSWLYDAGGENIYQQQIALKLGESWVCNSISEKIIFFTEQSGDARPCFWIKTQCKLNVIAPKNFSIHGIYGLNWRWRREGADSACSRLKKSAEEMLMTLSLAKQSSRTSLPVGKGCPVLWRQKTPTLNHCRSADLSAFVMLLWWSVGMDQQMLS